MNFKKMISVNLKSHSAKTIFVVQVAVILLLLASCSSPKINSIKNSSSEDYSLVWSDEFNRNGAVDTSIWHFEEGLVRNHEYQWYQKENAWQENGFLIIEARREKKLNPNYNPLSSDWRKAIQDIQYTSSSINTSKSKYFVYGRFEIRARINTESGLWPAFWTLGVRGEWPSNGEIDIMEYYKGNLLANVAYASSIRYKAKWFTEKKTVSSFNDPNWDKKFHTWRMDWNEESINLYVDNLLMNEVLLKDAKNPDGFNPFKQPHYILLNLAIGGDNGGDPSNSKFPNRYEIDYVRVYQKK